MGWGELYKSVMSFQPNHALGIRLGHILDKNRIESDTVKCIWIRKTGAMRDSSVLLLFHHLTCCSCLVYEA